jgi:hypothetical protein
MMLEGLAYGGMLPKGTALAICYLELAMIVSLMILKRIKLAALVYLTFLGSSLTEVNFLQDQGFVTASAFLSHPGFQSLRVPGLPIGWSTLLALLLFIFSFHSQKIGGLFQEKLKVLKAFMLFSGITLIFSIFSYYSSALSGGIFFKDINRFLIAIFSLGPVFINFTVRDAGRFLLAITLGALFASTLLLGLGVSRLYAGSPVALSVPAHAYVFLIALLFPGLGGFARICLFVCVVGFVFISNFLISGKTVISLILLASLVGTHTFGSRFSMNFRLVVLLLLLSCVLLIDFEVIGDFLIGQGFEIAGYKVKQLNFLMNFDRLSAEVFYHSSGGNLVAEGLTLLAMLIGVIPDHLPLIGLGFGGQVTDHFGILGLSNADSYPEEAFVSGRFSGMHLAFFGYIFWGGVVGVVFVWAITMRYILPARELWMIWAMIMSFWIFGLSEKFDATLFALLVSATLHDRSQRRHAR